jgi:ATP-dependent Clp protease, protease subunit
MNGMQPTINPLWDSGNYILMDGINDKSCLDAINFILYHNMKESPLSHLTIIINSPGGSVSAAFALIDVMKTSKIPVHTNAIGSIASCGVLLTMSGAKGNRTISETCQAMSHQYSWGAGGKHADLVASRKAQDMTDELLLNHYHKCTGKSRSFIKKNLLPHHDVWLTATEAVEMGIVDTVQEIY